jgi:hypothetical protein
LVDQFLPTHRGRGGMQPGHGFHDFALRLRQPSSGHTTML